MKNLFFVFLCLFSLSVLAQSKYKPVKSIEPFTSKSGHVFKVGDTLHLAKASMYDRTFKCGLLVPSKSGSVLGAAQGGPLTTSYEKTDWIIDHFLIYTVNGKPATYAYFKIENDIFHGEILIDCALDEGELRP